MLLCKCNRDLRKTKNIPLVGVRNGSSLGTRIARAMAAGFGENALLWCRALPLVTMQPPIMRRWKRSQLTHRHKRDRYCLYCREHRSLYRYGNKERFTERTFHLTTTSCPPFSSPKLFDFKIKPSTARDRGGRKIRRFDQGAICSRSRAGSIPSPLSCF